MSHVPSVLLDNASRLNRMRLALSFSRVGAVDVPLVFFNTKFKKLTGYGDEVLGQNCRFLQADFDNTGARSAIRTAFESRTQLQVVLANRKANGQAFSNLVFFGYAGKPGTPDHYIVASQFELWDAKVPQGGLVVPPEMTGLSADNPLRRFRMIIDRQRILSETMLRWMNVLLLMNRG